MAQNLVNQPQPDFTAAAQALGTVGTELTNFANLPAIQGGDAILRAI